tara:strand:+ start:956 stop:1120 length:165 start_codon:yes stop_codon:yes gene_type:complete
LLVRVGAETPVLPNEQEQEKKQPARNDAELVTGKDVVAQLHPTETLAQQPLAPS